MAARYRNPTWLRWIQDHSELTLYIVLILAMPLFQIGLTQVFHWLGR